MRRLLTAMCFLLAPMASAACQQELGMLASGLPAGMPLGTLAAQLLRGAVELVEPALPPLSFSRVPLESDRAGYLAALWLGERDLLPPEWQEQELSADVWDSMLAEFAGWYGVVLPDPVAGRELTREQLVSDLAGVLDQVSGAVRPVAVVALEAGEPVFLGVLWNWSVYPRLLVLRTEGADGLQQALAAASTCAVDVSLYVQASLDVAWRLFTGSGGNSSTMYVLDSDPARPEWPAEVDPAEVRDFLTFGAVPVRGLTSYSAIFTGEQMGVGTILSLALQVRTNVPLTRIGHYLAIPGQ